MSEVILINPPSLWPLSDYLEPEKIAAFPLGLALLASSLGDAGFAVSVIDCVAQDVRPSQLHARLEQLEEPALVGITVPFATVYWNAVEASRIVRRVFPKATIVFGGNHVTYLPETALKDSAADLICLNEGDFAVVEIANVVIRRQGTLDTIAGLVVKAADGHSTYRTNPRSLIEPLDRIPYPERTLFDREAYTEDAWSSVIVSRGCFGKCGFCSTMKFNGRKVRAMSFDRILAECDRALEGSETNYVNFYDDLFTHSMPWVEKFAGEKIRQEKNFTWGCMARIDTVNEALLRRMADAGCRSIFFGVESVQRESLSILGKRYDFAKASNIIRFAESVGIACTASFVIGLPGDSPSVEGDIMRFLEVSKPSALAIGMLTLFPGTDFATRPSDYGLRVLDEDWTHYGSEFPVTESVTFSAEEQFEAFLRIIRSFRRTKVPDTLELITGECSRAGSAPAI
jgi:radical SAM superfamily enzyme YgiQ (UPF0313 family)